MSSTVASSSLSLPNLPEEVWGKVFSFLFVQDLKSVRQTCHLFYDACNTTTFHKNEEIVFPAQIDPQTMKTLINMNRKVWNIKLEYMDLQREPILPFFQRHGVNIRSLTLVECFDMNLGSSSEKLPAIIELFESLRNFAVYFSPARPESGPVTIFEGFEILKRNKTVRVCVENLALIEIYQSYPNEHFNALSDGFYRSIFTVFPCIKQLEITVNVRKDFHHQLVPLRFRSPISRDALTFSTLYNQLFQMRAQLEKFKLYLMYNFKDETNLAECFQNLAQIEMPNLKEFSSNWPNPLDTFDATTSSMFYHLTEFKCFIGDTLPVTKSAFLHLLLESQKKLRYLHLITNDCVSMDEECFRGLVASNLKTLVIHRIYNYWNNWYSNSDIFHNCDESLIDYIGPSSIATNFELSSLDESLVPNYTLKTLKAHTLDRYLPLLFSAYFRCLDSFENYEIGDGLHDILDL